MAVELTVVLMLRDDAAAAEVLENLSDEYDVVAWDEEEV